jgi:hypothetical protein
LRREHLRRSVRKHDGHSLARTSDVFRCMAIIRKDGSGGESQLSAKSWNSAESAPQQTSSLGLRFLIDRTR